MKVQSGVTLVLVSSMIFRFKSGFEANNYEA